jgi:hypothetical protein
LIEKTIKTEQSFQSHQSLRALCVNPLRPFA